MLFLCCLSYLFFFFFFQAEDGIRDATVTGVQTCALPIFLKLVDQVVHADDRVGRQLGVVRIVDSARDVAMRVRDRGRRNPVEQSGQRSEERRVGKEWRARWAR